MFTSRKGALLAVFVVSMVATGILLAEPASPGSRNAGPTTKPSPGEARKYEYKGVWIGMTADAVKAKLEKPTSTSATEDQYVFSDKESAMVYYDETHKVRAIMITFSGDLKTAPSAKDVFGQDVPPKPDGGVFKMERYPKEGYWMSYNRSSGEDAVITIAVQKI